MKRLAQVALALVFFFAIAMVMNKIEYRYSWENTFWRTLLAPLTETIWAKDFSETNFAKIKNGMTSSEVLKILGEPLDKNCDKERCIWPYSDWGKGAIEFDRRWIVFDNQGRVNRVWHEFNID